MWSVVSTRFARGSYSSIDTSENAMPPIDVLDSGPFGTGEDFGSESIRNLMERVSGTFRSSFYNLTRPDCSTEITDATAELHEYLKRLLGVLRNRLEGDCRYKEKGPSEMNFLLRKPDNPDRSTEDDEVRLETRIAYWHDRFFFQSPVASGLLTQHSDKRSAIDLVEALSTTPLAFALTELKLDRDDPVLAAQQLSGYGVLYLQARECYPPYLIQDHPLLRASKIILRVLMPGHRYAGFAVGLLTEALTNAFKLLALDLGQQVDMSFEFWRFPESFVWPCEKEALIECLAGRVEVR